MVEGNKPEKKFSTGAISATIWKNAGTDKKSGEPTEFRSVNLDRRYTDKEGNWQSTNSLRLNDIPKASLVLNKAYEYLILKDPGAKPAVANTETESKEEVVM